MNTMAVDELMYMLSVCFPMTHPVEELSCMANYHVDEWARGDQYFSAGS